MQVKLALYLENRNKEIQSGSPSNVISPKAPVTGNHDGAAWIPWKSAPGYSPLNKISAVIQANGPHTTL